MWNDPTERVKLKRELRVELTPIVHQALTKMADRLMDGFREELEYLDRCRDALWECYVASGADTDGATSWRDSGYDVGIGSKLADIVPPMVWDLRREYDGDRVADHELRLASERLYKRLLGPEGGATFKDEESLKAWLAFCNTVEKVVLVP